MAGVIHIDLMQKRVFSDPGFPGGETALGMDGIGLSYGIPKFSVPTKPAFFGDLNFELSSTFGDKHDHSGVVMVQYSIPVGDGFLCFILLRDMIQRMGISL